MTRPIAAERLGMTTSVEDAMTMLAEAWLRAMAPEKTAGSVARRRKK